MQYIVQSCGNRVLRAVDHICDLTFVICLMALDPALDFFSTEFDPGLALSTPGLVPPEPDARPLDNVAKCRSILPQEVPEALSNVEKRAGSEV